MIIIIILNIIINLLLVALMSIKDAYLLYLRWKPSIIAFLERFCIKSIYNGHHLERWHICPCLREKEDYPDYYEVDLEIPKAPDQGLLQKLKVCFSKRKPKPEPRPAPI